MPGAVIVGSGPGIGRSVAARFAREGLAVGLLSRSGSALGLDGVRTYRADCGDEGQLRAALDAATGALGTPDVVVYNAAIIRPDTLGAVDARAQLDAWAVNVVGAMVTASHVVPAMARRGGGTFIVTGGMPEPKAAYVSLSLGKVGVRALVAMVDEEYGAAGVHAASVTVAGVVAPGTAFDPDDIAEHYWRLHTQPREGWEREVVHTGGGR
ncbi:SDR family NAD(P)-dependent oxidoreductase [Nonomuraea gerenzanensis]|uniref:Short-chain dehydrogenase/reductase SDR n=1 Tax=Nonomuraea gerenzanensis TaxID=93944 RepID=A0A1M4E6A1_9ACTN|nr:SDR family NAD(P)-dependent oxidoreductase [Nonomuraea gerenzanensis]UBU16550.1 SDR family NAD(P)-dependent oxidoreductase [Nonomuraea gerenzanensis]SBO94376.1 short-chain dehydrogenase/reductase SDR [Nonomuraea gerenzanensis]